MDQLNEFNSVLSVMSLPPMSSASLAPEVTAAPAGLPAAADTAVPPPAPKYKGIYVSPACFEQANTTPDGMTVFNLVFDVSYTDENDCYKRFKVAKQISVCPEKLAQCASTMQPIQVIESKSAADAFVARMATLGGV
jgi:hypothetical protein